VPIQVAGLALLFPQESGSLAMFTAIRRASSLRSLPLNNGSFLLDDTPCVASLTLRSCSRSILSSSCLFWVPWAAEIRCPPHVCCNSGNASRPPTGPKRARSMERHAHWTKSRCRFNGFEVEHENRRGL